MVLCALSPVTPRFVTPVLSFRIESCTSPMTGSLPPFVFGAPIAAFAVTWMAITVLLRTFSDRILDHPNERSLHQRPVPRTGGLGVAAGIAVSVSLVSPVAWWPLWVGAVLLVVISFLDDLINLPVVSRLVMHFVAGSGLVCGLLFGQIGLGWAAVVVIATVWMINLYNFMDGMDGLAGGMSMIGFSFLSVAAWFGGSSSLALVSASIAAASGAFLLFNFYPARMFLGDAGSTTLGFLAAGLGLIGWRDGVWSLWFPVLVFSPFVIDASVTLLKRIARGERFWKAHREHCYQRLVLSGWSHRKTALVEYSLMFLCGIGALMFQRATTNVQIAILGCWILLTLSLFLGVSWAERRDAARGH